jgi:hypothetical protein
MTNWHRFEPLKHSSTTPFAFTEHGVAMLASVPNSPRAVEISIFIVKTFVELRKMMYTHKALYNQIALLKMRVDKHNEELRAEPPPKRRIGFVIEEPRVKYTITRKRR